MSDVTRLLDAVERGEPQAAADLIPLVYDELRRLAAYQLARERPGQTLQATALVHEAYLRLVTTGSDQWENRRHFFGAAAEAMRRILVERARRKTTQKLGGGHERVALDEIELAQEPPAADVLAVHEAIEELARTDPQAAELVKLRFFIGLSMEQAAELLGVSRRTAQTLWSLGRAWLRSFMDDQVGGPE